MLCITMKVEPKICEAVQMPILLRLQELQYVPEVKKQPRGLCDVGKQINLT